MSVEIVMPRLGLNMETGLVAKWMVQEGDAFREGDELCEVESDKSVASVKAEFDGKVIKRLVELNENVQVIAPILLVEKL